MDNRGASHTTVSLTEGGGEAVDPATGEICQAQVFVAVLGASSYTFAEATWTQSLPDWFGSHVRALAFFGGAPQVLVPDNLRAAVTQPHRYEPQLNRTYYDCATHYAMAIVPARVAKPRDKAKAEVGVQVVERWILATLRNRVFFSLNELNAHIAHLLERLNNRPFRKLPGCRRSAFEAIEQPALQPLPQTPYEFAEWKKVRVHIDYHVELEAITTPSHTACGQATHRPIYRHHRGDFTSRPARRQPSALPPTAALHHRR
ncbi:MAG: IS21 family transposase [Chromatiales bacterium]|nr:IS21 family transposase [Chromatiales bacterium]